MAEAPPTLRPRFRSCRRAALVGLALLLAPPLLAEVIVLHNGQVLSGSLRSESDTHVTLTRHGQSITLQRADIASIDRADTSYYQEEYQRALEAEDTPRARRLFELMKRHPEPAVREKGHELERLFAGGGNEPDWPGVVDLEKASLEELYTRLRLAADRVRWDDAVEIGRVIRRRHTPPVSYYATMLEACRQTRRETAQLILDAERIFLHGSNDPTHVSQVYLANEFENRILRLWNEQRPERTDAEIHACLLARGLVFHSAALREAPADQRALVEGIYADLVTTDDWDYATRRVPRDHQLLLFAGASRIRGELVPVIRYFSLLKEQQILSATTDNPVLEGPLREARAAYIYTISEVIPLPKDKLWASARDLALVRHQQTPRISDIIREVFDYTPERKHPELAMAYEGILVEEALGNRDQGEGLRTAVRLIARRRCGANFDEVLSWQAFSALATLEKGAGREGRPVTLSLSDVMAAALALASPTEKEQVCLAYEKRLTDGALAGEYGDGLLEALRTIAARRGGDTSDEAIKWQVFRALAALRRDAFTAEQADTLTVSEVLEAAWSVLPAELHPRLAVAFETRLIEATRGEATPTLHQAIRHLATWRGQDLSDPTASWRAFSAVASLHAAGPGAQPPLPEPAVSQVFDAAFAAAPAQHHARLAVLFEDVVQEAVRGSDDRGSGLHRAVELASRTRLSDPLADSHLVWRAVETHARYLHGPGTANDDVLAMLEELSRRSTDQRVVALNTAAAHYANAGDDATFVRYRDRWIADIVGAIDAWVVESAATSVALPVTFRLSPGLVAQVPALREGLQRMTDHRSLVETIEGFESRLRARYRPGRNLVPDDALTGLVVSLNDYWAGTRSPAVQRRILTMIEEVFDEPTRVRLVQAGLRLDTPPS